MKRLGVCVVVAMVACGGSEPHDGDDAATQDTADVAAGDVDATGLEDAGATAPGDVDAALTTAGDTADATNAAADTDDAGDVATAGPCPPAPPFGVEVGDVLAEADLVDCDGQPYPLHQLCGRPAVVLFTFAGWCPPCRAAAEAAPGDYAELLERDPDVEMVVVVAETHMFERPTLAYCEAIRDGYGLTMPVLVDVGGTFPEHIGVTSTNSWHLVLEPGMRINYKAKYGHAGSLEAARALLTQ